MKKDSFGIADGGEQRLRDAVADQVRREFEAELSAAGEDPSQKAAVEQKIQQKIKDEMKRLASPYSLWGSA
jgi:hypothetical protein